MVRCFIHDLHTRGFTVMLSVILYIVAKILAIEFGYAYILIENIGKADTDIVNCNLVISIPNCRVFAARLYTRE